ncbi:MAG: hypothetical protein RLZZ158_584 [Cyanobacteriota bacterium]|jgi:tetratricopeptide (TPR) repeat protein
MAENSEMRNSDIRVKQFYGQALMLPKPDSARLAVQAGEFFAQAEEFNRCGAPEMASPLYRQAYTLLHGAVANNPEGSFTHPIRSIDLQPALVEIQSAPMPPQEPPGPAGASSAAVNNDWLDELPGLRARLSAESAGEIAARLASLRQAGYAHAELHRMEGLTALILQDTSTAVQRFREALGLDPNHYSSLVNLAGLLLPEGRHEEATALLHRALDQVNPESPEAVPALTNLSLAHQLAGRPMDEALLVLRIHRLKPGHLRNERLLQAAGILEQMGEDPAAIELLSWLRERQPLPEVLRSLGSLLERRGDYQEAALVYRQLLQPINGESAVS